MLKYVYLTWTQPRNTNSDRTKQYILLIGSSYQPSPVLIRGRRLCLCLKKNMSHGFMDQPNGCIYIYITFFNGIASGIYHSHGNHGPFIVDLC